MKILSYLELPSWLNYDQTVTQTTQNNVSIRFSTGSMEKYINTSIEVPLNTMEYFLKNLNYVILF